MDRKDYARITRGKGRELRDFMEDAIREPRDQLGRRELRARMDELLPADEFDADVRKRVLTRWIELARGAADRCARFELRQHAANFAADVVRELEEADRLVNVEEQEPIDMDAIMESTDRYSDMVGGDLQRQHDKERAEAQELLRRAGYQP
jgi:hypothetical protein